MVDIWFVVGVAMGTIVTGFCAIGSYERGSSSVQRKSWAREHDARRRAVVASRSAVRAASRSVAEGAFRKAS